ncbi:MAG: ATP-grasp domain-containing protein [Planctomycetota bacterium]|nr:ATP-grasp domain-containing protein [Planctomycetota bacterium]
MNVLMISPGFPDEMPLFTRGLAEVGARVYGIGDQPRGALAAEVRESLADYRQVPDLWDEESMIQEVREWLEGKSLDRIECLWEPGVVLAARLREEFGIPGLSVEQAIPFRDKERMKQVLDDAGIRTPRHARAKTETEVREAAERIGYPLIVKPIAGAGSADTYSLRGPDDLEPALGLVRHVPEVSVEEYIEGEEYTYDTVCGDGEILFENVAWYRPKPLTARLNEWISMQGICLLDLETAEIAVGRDLGHRVIEALGFGSGFAHMEWFRTPEGEAVFGEIGARSPGGRLVHAMNHACDIDLFVGWAEAVCRGTLSQDTTKLYNAAVVFKRARGPGERITRIEGLQSVLTRYGEHICNVQISPVGAPRRDWRRVVSGDGWIVARHPDLEFTLEIADAIGTDVALFAD